MTSTAPQKTRDHKFQESFRKYIMQDLCINEMVYVLDYNLTNQTANKSRCIHTYQLEIFGNVESMFHTGENVVDILPTTRDFIHFMKDFFEQFELKEGTRNKKMSYIEYLTRETGDPVTTISFRIVYHKDHLPFPVPLSMTEELQNEIVDLHGEIHRFERKNLRLHRKITALKDAAKNVQARVQNKHLDLLRTSGLLNTATHTCPVCYDILTTNTIQIPLCFHYICKGCKDRCTNCPLCRENYVPI
uniref:RING-type domain-containing protein n=1 Tax=viral metagenome TaxID=1070528 RepID=A0A6C0INQ3_9ZZZZ